MRFSDSAAAGGRGSVSPLLGCLNGVAADLAGAPVIVGSLDEGTDVVRSLGRLERVLEGVRLQVSRQIDDLGTEGQSLSAEDMFASVGRLSDGAARRAARRAQLAEFLPQVGVAGDAGDLGVEHMDAVGLAR